MTDKVILHEIPPSPNNVKVRIALNYKEIPFERRPIPFDLAKSPAEQDRSTVIAVSRQPLTPTLQHGDRVIFDSGAILRYLEANFPKTRPLFSTDWATMKKLEEWEWFARTSLGEPLRIVFSQARAASPDLAARAAASRHMADLTARIEEQLGHGPFLMGEQMTAADVTAAPLVALGMLPDQAARLGGVVKFLQENLKLGGGRDRTREWAGRVTAYDK